MIGHAATPNKQSQFDAEFTSMPIMSPNTKESLIGSSHDNTFNGFSFTESSLGLG